MLSDVKEILEFVSSLFVKYGIKSNTMDDIASKLGISKKTLYQFFKDKDDLVNKVTDNMFYKKQSDLHKISLKELNVVEELYEIHKQIITMLKEYSNVMMNDLRKYYLEKYNGITQKYRQLIEEMIFSNIQKGKENGIYRQNVNGRIIAKSQVARVMNIPENFVVDIEEYTSKNFSDELFEYQLRGLIDERSIEVSNSFIKKINYNKYVDHEGSQIN